VQYAAQICWGFKLELSLGFSLRRFRVPNTAVNQEGVGSRTVHSHSPQRECARARERERARERASERERLPHRERESERKREKGGERERGRESERIEREGEGDTWARVELQQSQQRC